MRHLRGAVRLWRARGVVARLGVGALAVGVLASGARAQLVPQRLYYGVGQAAPVEVQSPAGVDAAGLSIRLVRMDSGTELARAAVAPGPVDLSAMFPVLWSQEPGAVPRAVWAQLVGRRLGEDGKSGAEEPIGGPLVVQRLETPERFELDERVPQAPRVVAPEGRQGVRVLTGLRVYADKLVRMETDAGELLIRLRPDEAPNTAWNFRELAGGGFYTGVVFHRVVPVGRSGGGFVIQGGDPSGTGEGGPGYEIDLERSGLGHDFGVVSMARDRAPNTAGSQFFVCLTRQETARLDGLYTAFAEVIAGEGTIAAIAATPLEPGEANRPVTPPRIIRVELVDAPAAGTGPGRVGRGQGGAR